MQDTHKITETTTYPDGSTETITLLHADYDTRVYSVEREIADAHGNTLARGVLLTNPHIWEDYDTGDTPHRVSREHLDRLTAAANRLVAVAERSAERQ